MNKDKHGFLLIKVLVVCKDFFYSDRGYYIKNLYLTGTGGNANCAAVKIEDMECYSYF